MKKLLFFAFILFSFGLLAQPANDNCTGAQALGTLGNPAACGTGIQDGATTTVAGTLNGATPENPYVTEAPCAGGTMAAPGNDVWYSFTCPANGVQGTIVISGAAFTPNVAVWQGTCAAMTGVGCAVGTAGSCTVNLPSLVPGDSYLIQVSGNTGQTGAFTLKATAFVDCSVCNQSSIFTANPTPPASGYAPGQTVNFCYHVSDWNQVNDNWLHGVTVTLGAGWNAASLVATPPASCDGNGTWAYYPAGQTSCASGVLWGPGFYYTSSLGVSTCPGDGPGNTYGDNCSGAIAAGTWNFCFDVTVAAGCNPGASLQVTCLSSGDGQSGSWSSTGCLSDVASNANSALNCCPPTMSMTGATCGATGSATASAVVGGAGSQAPYVFQWTGPSGPVSTTTVNPGTSNTINNLPAGTYTVVVTDKNLCASTNTIVVTGGGGITSAVTPHNITCAATGSITTTNATGGTAPYTYSWTGPGAFSSTVQSPIGLTTAGVYTLVVTDHVGCTFTTTATLAQTGAITVTVNSPTICAGGAVTLTATGGTTYSWSTGATTNPITVTPGATSYTVVGTTGTCTNSAVSTVGVTALPVVNVNNATICPGGTATLTATGGTTYSWNTGATTASITESPGATTSFTVTGTTNTCTNSAVGTITVGAGIAVTVNNATMCAGTSTVLTANGATTYSWAPAAGLSATTGATVTANPGATTTYTVTGTSAGCTGTGTSVVTVNPIPLVTASSTSVCAGSTGTITAGGATTYSWNTGATTAAITETPGGTTSYTVTGTTANCTNTAVGTVSVSASVTVTVNDPIICTGSTTTLTATGATTYTWNTGATTNTIVTTPATTTTFTVTGEQNGCSGTSVGTVSVVSNPTVTVTSGTICTGGSVVLTAAGASHYTWTPAAGLSSTTTTTVTANPTTTTTYTVVGAAGTCTTSGTGMVTVNALPVLTVTSSTICVGQEIGTLSVTGANTYTWTGGGITGTNATNPTDNPLNTTTYTVNAMDINSCTATATGTITANPVPTLTVTSASICSGTGPATLGVAGANTYTWTGGGITGSNSSAPSDNPASTTVYTVNGANVATCTATATGTITVMGTPTITVNNGAICSGQTTLVLTAASNAATFSWTPAAGLSSTTGNPVIANPGATTTYTVVGTTGTCTVSGTAMVTVHAPSVLTVTGSTICVGQEVGTLGVNGANTYTWTGGGITGSNAANPTDNPVITTTYSVNGTDINTCTATATGVITVNPLPVVTVNTATICVGQQTATLIANGANNYAWNPATTLSSNTGASVTGTPTVTADYTVTGTDANTCTNTATSTITVNPLPTVTVNISAICIGQQTATLTAGGAVTYIWSPSATLNSNTGTSVTGTPIITTNYTVTGTDANGCTNIATSTITVNPLPTVTVNTSAICIGQQTATLTAGGAVTYTWTPSATLSSNAGTSVTGTPTVTTDYTIAGTDANGCVNVTTSTITVHPLPTVTATSSTICIGQQIATLIASGAVSYVWIPATGLTITPPGSSVTGSPTVSTTYVVIGTDANGCEYTATTNIIVNPLPTVTATSSTICVGQQLATLTASGASTYAWTPSNTLSGSIGATVIGTPITSTSYTVTGTDNNGCMNTATTSILVNPLPIVITNTISPDCIPLNAVFTATSTPAASSYIWNFSNGPSISTTFNPSSSSFTTATSYTYASVFPVTLSVTDIQGCVGTASISVTTFAIPIANFDYAQQPVSILAPEVQFINQSTPGLPYYNWNFGDIYNSSGNDTSFLINPSYTYSVVGTYSVTLTVSTANGCSATVTKPIIINDMYALYVPNAFSPNGDGKNEMFLAEGEGISDFKMYVFDRWGLLLFYSEDINKGWDGRYQAKGSQILQEDVYVWKIQATDFQNIPRNLHGTVTLLK